MASVRSILGGGRTATRSEPGEPAKKPGQDLGGHHEKMMEALQAQIAQLTGQLGVAHADLSAARAETAAERDRVTALRAQLLEQAHQVSQAQADLAGARAAAEGLEGQLRTEREARAELAARLEQAIAAATAKQPVNVPAHVPVAYEVVMVDPDTGKRKQVSIKPKAS